MGNGDVKCRLCLKKSVTRHSNIFKDDLPTKLMTIAAVKVEENDGLPAHICTNCRNLVHTSYNFKCQIERSDRNLRETLRIKDSYDETGPISNNNDDRTVPTYCIVKNEVTTSTEQSDIKINYKNIFCEKDSKSQFRNKYEDDYSYSDDEKPLVLRTNRHKCNHCIKSFANSTSLEKHAMIHRRKHVVYGCYVCNKQFLTAAEVKSHAIEVHSAQMDEDKILRNTKIKQLNICLKKIDCSVEKENDEHFTCKVCDRRLTTSKLYRHHMRTHIDIAAELYRNTSPSPDSRKNNRKDSHALRLTTLEKNNVAQIDENHNNNWNEKENEDCKFEDDHSDKEEEEEDIYSKKVKCKKCDKYFSTTRNLRRHMLIHSDRKFPCDVCKKDFSRPDKLREHLAIVHKIDLYQGSDTENDCGDENSTVSSHRKKRYLPYKCSLCPRAFAHELSLDNHEAWHKKPKKTKKSKDNRKRFLCHVCSKCFAQSGGLQAHVRTHTGVRPYVCNICSRAFAKSTYLKLHLRMHSGEKPYVCQHCNKAFARANTLARHITIHTGEAKYHCKFCKKSFRRLTSLNEHTYTHTGQKPYSCKICFKRYNNAGSLYAHTKRCKILQATGKLKTNSSASETQETISEVDSTNSIDNSIDSSIDNSIENSIENSIDCQFLDFQPMSNFSAFSNMTAMENALTPDHNVNNTSMPNILILTDKDVQNLMTENTATPETCQFMITNIEGSNTAFENVSINMTDINEFIGFNSKQNEKNPLELYQCL